MASVAVVGGGVFGTTAAIQLARAGHDVHLFERLSDILQAASAINQYRLHRGYHYPRSAETAASALAAETSFRAEYGAAVVDDGEHLYAIAREGSLVDGQAFLKFCDAHGLTYERVDDCGLVNPDMIELVIRAREARFDPNRLRELIRHKLQEVSVTAHLSIHATRQLLEPYDQVVIAAYAGAAELVDELTGRSLSHQYEVCEKPVVSLPPSFGRTDLVVMDGPFMCIDPVEQDGTYVLGNVVHAIHASNTGMRPIVPDGLAPLLNRGVVINPPISNFSRFIESGGAYIPALREAQHLGSLFTIRTVLPHQDATDARPTTVSVLDDRHLYIFSGKIGNCVSAASEVAALVAERTATPRSA